MGALIRGTHKTLHIFCKCNAPITNSGRAFLVSLETKVKKFVRSAALYILPIKCTLGSPVGMCSIKIIRFRLMDSANAVKRELDVSKMV